VSEIAREAREKAEPKRLESESLKKRTFATNYNNGLGQKESKQQKRPDPKKPKVSVY